MSAPTLHIVHGQPSWSLKSAQVDVHLTKLGGHLGPVVFDLGDKQVAPFSVAPWAEEQLAPGTPALLRALRGDFFCAPFGGNGTPWKGETHPPHGETANASWRLQAFESSAGRQTLHARLDTTVRAGSVDKFITLVQDQTVVYQEHRLTAKGPMTVGHHAMLKFPPTPGSGIVSTSRFVHAQVLPDLFERPEAQGYTALKTGAIFRKLDRVPLLNGGFTDLTSYPARRGFDDLVMLTADPELPFAWNAVTYPKDGYVYFSLRDPATLRHTLLWISNGGRYYAPWNGRHTDVMGIEDTTSYFHYGLAESAKPNPLSRRGLPTTLTLNPKKPLSVRYLFGVAAIPRSFDRVQSIKATRGGIELVAANGRRTVAAVNLDFLRPDGTLESVSRPS